MIVRYALICLGNWFQPYSALLRQRTFDKHKLMSINKTTSADPSEHIGVPRGRVVALRCQVKLIFCLPYRADCTYSKCLTFRAVEFHWFLSRFLK